MFRNEKGQFVRADQEPNLDDKIKEAEANLANLKAEREKALIAKREAESAVRKADATKVETAFREMNTARKNYNDVEREAKEQFNKTMALARKIYNEKVDPEIKKVEEAQNKYKAELEEFQKNHKNYHMTLSDPENDCTQTLISNSLDRSFADSLFDMFWNAAVSLISD